MSKSSVGRPSKLTAAVVSKLEDAFMHGASVTEACYLSGISRETFYKYYLADESFSDKMERSRNWLSTIAKRNLVEAVRSGDLKASVWVLEKRNTLPDNSVLSELPKELKPTALEQASKDMDLYIESRIRQHTYALQSERQRLLETQDQIM